MHVKRVLVTPRARAHLAAVGQTLEELRAALESLERGGRVPLMHAARFARATERAGGIVATLAGPVEVFALAEGAEEIAGAPAALAFAWISYDPKRDAGTCGRCGETLSHLGEAAEGFFEKHRRCGE